MKLPLHIAQKIQQMVAGSGIPASAIKHSIVTKLLDDGILHKQQQGKSKALIFIANKTALPAYLYNTFGISNLDEYVQSLTDEGSLTRSDSIIISGNSKLQRVRTFNGFIVNCYSPLPATLNGKQITILPPEGSYTFISDWQHFIPHPSITVVGIENPENFRQIYKQQYLFNTIKPLFVSRYPQNSDLIQWLKMIPNQYVHFGDMDFEGIKIYMNEYKKHLLGKASFFVPPNTEELLNKYGNRQLYNNQYKQRLIPPPDIENAIVVLTQLLLQYKKVLEQEIFIKQPTVSV